MQVYKFTCIKAYLISKIVKYYRIFTIKLKMCIVPRNVHMPLIILIIQSKKQRITFSLLTTDLSSYIFFSLDTELE